MISIATSQAPPREYRGSEGLVTLFLAGDVMTGRGVDQIMPHPVDPILHEPYMKSALGYVQLAERASGPIPRPVAFEYIWGDALPELRRVAPDARIINLETSVTRSDDYWRGKVIHYRMSPDNVSCIAAAGIDVCSLANNHVLDWGHRGLDDTLAALERVSVACAGAGSTLERAQSPAIVKIPGKGRVLVFSLGTPDSGIPLEWTATPSRPGLYVVNRLFADEVQNLRARVDAVRRPGDIVVVSIHWGPNWGFEIRDAEVSFAHALIDAAGADVIHGHSSHHVKAIEVYRDRLILYGCGDFIDDYEGITGYEEFRDDLGLMFFPTLDPDTGALVRMRMTPTQIRNMRVRRATGADLAWLRATLDEQGARLGTSVKLAPDGTFELHWR